MKVTIEEVQEVIDELEADHRKELDVEIKLGIEDDGDMAIVLLTKVRSTRIIMDMYRKVGKLGRRHNESYLVVVMWNSAGWFKHYQRESGFEELSEPKSEPVEPPFPIEFRWEKDYVAIYFFGKAQSTGYSHKTVAQFCRENLQESANRRV